MRHSHVESHLLPRQRHRQHDEEEEEEVEKQDEDEPKVVKSIKVITMPNTFTGKVVWVTAGGDEETKKAPQTLIAPTAVKPTSTEDDPEPTTKAEASSKNAATTKESAPKTTLSPSVEPSSLVVATNSPVQTVPSNLVGLLSASATATAAISATPSAEAAATGMSGGAKAGLALGILLGVGALLAVILLIYKKKKNSMRRDSAHDDREKAEMAMADAPPPPPPQVQAAPAAPSIRSNRTHETAPRLSLRPVTQFSPTFGDNRKSAGNMLVAAGAVPSSRHGQEERSGSPWERPGQNAHNPFNDPEPRSVSPQDPFGNNAAIETPQVSAPGTPLHHTPNHSAAPSTDFANPAAAIAAAEAAGTIAAAGAMANVSGRPAPPPTHELPPPPSIRSNADSVPPSPAWTDDIPASPGPAPTGPPPIAVAGGRPNGPAPAPAPTAANNVHRVQLDFKPSMADELELHAGQLVRMLHEYDDGWALCIRMDRTQQGVVPRTCLSKHPVKPRNGPPRQGGPPVNGRTSPGRSPMGPGGPQPRPHSPATPARSESPHPPSLSPAGGRMSPAPRSMSPSPRQMSPPQGTPRGRSNSNAPYAGAPRSMSPGPYGGGPQMTPPPQMGRPRSNSASQAIARRPSPPGPSPMNPNATMMPRKPLPGQAL